MKAFRQLCNRDGASLSACLQGGQTGVLKDPLGDSLHREATFWRVAGYMVNPIEKDEPMLRYAIIFLVIAVIAAVLGFGGIAGASAGIAQIIFYIFLVLFVIGLVSHLLRKT